MNINIIKTTIEDVPFADLYVSDMNPRSVINDASIEALAENIKELGLIQNLAGIRDDDGKVAIVAGGRRLRALVLLQDDPRFATVPVQITDSAELAQTWASSENHQREQPHAADEIREYGAMAARNVPVAAISVAFGVTEAHVYRRLKLASLPSPVLDALKEGQISLGQAAAFTISTDEKRTLEVLAQTNSHDTEYWIKSRLKPDTIKSSERRAVFVGVDAYKDAGGRATQDLFADVVLLDDEDILEDLFAKKLAEVAAGFTADGWKWADVLTESHVYIWDIEKKIDRIYPEPGVFTEEQAERYDELAELHNGDVLDAEGIAELEALQKIEDGEYTDEQKAHAGVYVYVDHSGDLCHFGGLIKREDRKTAIEAGVLEKSKHEKPEVKKCPISDSLRADLNRVVLGAKQHALLNDPDLVIDLLAYQLSHNLRWYSPLGISLVDVPNWPTTEAEGFQLDERLTENPPRDMHETKDFGASFRAFRKKGADHIRGELVRFLAAQFRGGDKTLAAYVTKETTPNTRAVWTPTKENFFKRVGGPYLVTLWTKLLGLAEDHPTVTTFAKLKKGEKEDKLHDLFNDEATRDAYGLTEEQAERIANWLPEGME